MERVRNYYCLLKLTNIHLWDQDGDEGFLSLTTWGRGHLDKIKPLPARNYVCVRVCVCVCTRVRLHPCASVSSRLCLPQAGSLQRLS